MSRALATVQKIVNIRPIEGADKIEVAQVLDWECVVSKKDNFQKGNYVVYIEIDSIIPENLLKIAGLWDDEKGKGRLNGSQGTRVQTRKFRGQISQGLILPVSILPSDFAFAEDVEVTEILGISKHDPQLQEEQACVQVEHRSQTMKFLMGIPAFRKIYLKLNNKPKGSWPDWISKTDEERIQGCSKIFFEHFNEMWDLSEKLDGTSTTFFTYKSKVWGFPKMCFGVASRNIWLKTPDNSNYWQIAKIYDLEKKMKDLGEIVIQGEIVGPRIQKNKYNLTRLDFYVFNIVQNGKRLSYAEMTPICCQLGLKQVPFIGNLVPSSKWEYTEDHHKIIQEMITMSDAHSQLFATPREGLVWRLNSNPLISFKVINPNFLLKNDE